MALFESDNLAGNEKSPSALFSLHTLRWDTHYGPAKGDVVTFSSVKNTIEFLDIAFGQYAGSMGASVFDLATMKNLKRLRITNDRMENTAVFSPIIDIGLADSDLLDWLQVPGTLELFELNYVIYLGEDVLSMDPFLDSFATNQWSRLNQFFSSHNFTKVKGVALTPDFARLEFASSIVQRLNYINSRTVHGSWWRSVGIKQHAAGFKSRRDAYLMLLKLQV
ncbi:unnamed protein product [Cyclocybe aegerita]|uniref:Uncharacterized protein n=1 Tax=Cyclocybe aegerita TaxID=1973307 RepID=A0A8S0VTQ8_CYCAE|nr:unnamed protein product [Cyclocybe aegerita]